MTTAACKLFATIPPPAPGAADGYLAAVRGAARAAEAAGFAGALVYSDNHTVDPWVVAQAVLAATERFEPLVALQPVYAHPYAVAKKIASYAFVYGRRICLNLVAGGVRNDLLALGDPTPHDERYDRLIEYTQLIERLLTESEPVTFEGRYYGVQGLPLVPAMPPQLRPLLYISGSSPAGLKASEVLDAVPVRYPEPSGEAPYGGPRGGGVRIGIIARDTDEEAWSVAHERFPKSRAGRLAQMAARGSSDSHWTAKLSAAEEFPGGPESPYWMGPFLNYATYCPYLVGSHEKVEAELVRYVEGGCEAFIMDTARDDGDYAAVAATFARVSARIPAPTAAPAAAPVAR